MYPPFGLVLPLSCALLTACGARSTLAELESQDSGAGCVPSQEICNGVDDNCNGFVDEHDDAEGLGCDTGLGGLCSVGTLRCDRGALVCVVDLHAEEVCNGLDDDCNGAVDDGDPGAGATCATGTPGTCAQGSLHCVDGELACVPSRGPSPEICNQLDDDCNGIVDDDPACLRRIFVTSQFYTGDLGGLEGADAKCQTLADAANLGGTYKAWLSSTRLDARDRLSHVGKPYVRVDGLLVAYDWTDLTDVLVPLYNPIYLTELGGLPPISDPYFAEAYGSAVAYTSTLGNGTIQGEFTWNPAYTCYDWTSQRGTGGLGIANLTVENWTQAVSTDCSIGASLYCFEQ